MALTDDVARSAEPFLDRNEPIEGVVVTQTGNPLLVALGVVPAAVVGGMTGGFPGAIAGAVLVTVLWAVAVNRYRIVVATPRRILVLDAGRWSGRRARAIVDELPRETRIGPGAGAFQRIRVGDHRLYVAWQFRTEVARIDRAQAGRGPADT